MTGEDIIATALMFGRSAPDTDPQLRTIEVHGDAVPRVLALIRQHPELREQSTNDGAGSWWFNEGRKEKPLCAYLQKVREPALTIWPSDMP